MEPIGSTDSLLHRQVRKNRGEGVRPLVERKVPLSFTTKKSGKLENPLIGVRDCQRSGVVVLVRLRKTTYLVINC
jgi:hypothetical protein